MRDMVVLELLFVRENEIRVFVKDEEDAPVYGLEKDDIIYVDGFLEPETLVEFTVPETIAIGLGWV